MKMKSASSRNGVYVKPSLVAFIVILCLTCAFGQDLTQISQDPYTDPQAQHATEVEPVVVAVGNTIVTAFQVGRFFGVGADNIGWATSHDGGKTWERGFLPATTTVAGGGWPAVSLPTIAYDRKHKKFLVAMMPYDDQGNGRGVLVSRSSDGLHWSRPIVAASSLGANGHWLACDNSAASPYYGNCYDAFLDYSSGTSFLNILVASNDGGRTWGSQVNSPDQEAGLVTSIAIQPKGNLVVLGRNGGVNGDQEYAIRSADGGQTLDATANITAISFIYPFMRADPNLTSGVDAHGTIYVVFPDCRFRSNCEDPFAASICRYVTDNTSCPTNDLVLTKSEDGINWSPVQRIPIDPVTSSSDHLIAGVAVFSASDDGERDASNAGSHTRIALTYYYLPNGQNCSPTTCRIRGGSIFSENGGRSWHQAAKITPPMLETWMVPTYAGEMVADYSSAAFVDGEPYGVFAIAQRPDSKTGQFDEAIYAARLPTGSE